MALVLLAPGLWVQCGGRAELLGFAPESDLDAGSDDGAVMGGAGGSLQTSSTTGGGSPSDSFTTTASVVTTGAASMSAGGTGEPPQMPCNPPAPACRGLPASDIDPSDFCVGSGYEREAIAVHLFLVVDSSAEMNASVPPNQSTRWQVTSEALLEFLADEDMTAVDVALRLYSSADPDRCDPSDYLSPTVSMLDPSQSLADFAKAFMDTHPDGTAMTRAAFTGTLATAQAWRSNHLAAWPVVLLVGGPRLASCEAPVDFDDIAALASDAIDQYGVPAGALFVDADFEPEIGSCGEPRGVAWVVDSGLGSQALHDALLELYEDITPQPSFPCEFEIPAPPSGQIINFDRARFAYSAKASEFEFPRVASRADCEGSPYGGWYYDGFDDSGSPTRIVLCPCACSELPESKAGNIEWTLGCLPGRGIE